MEDQSILGMRGERDLNGCRRMSDMMCVCVCAEWGEVNANELSCWQRKKALSLCNPLSSIDIGWLFG